VVCSGCNQGFLALDSGLGVDGEDPVGAVRAVPVVPDGLDVQGEAFAGDGAGDHILVVNVQLDVGDGLAVLEALVDFFLQGGDCLGVLGLDGLLDDLGAESDGHQLVDGTVGIGTGAESGEMEPAGQFLADPGLAQMVASVESCQDHLLADGSLEIALDFGGKSEHLFLGVDRKTPTKPADESIIHP
jgi:hypothetical protein